MNRYTILPFRTPSPRTNLNNRPGANHRITPTKLFEGEAVSAILTDASSDRPGYTLTRSQAPFLSGILHILGLGTEKQMRGIHAKGIIAGMAYAKPFTYRTVNHLPNISMGADGLSLDLELTVSRTAGAFRACCPDPAAR